jgi:hypothetical protein
MEGSGAVQIITRSSNLAYDTGSGILIKNTVFYIVLIIFFTLSLQGTTILVESVPFGGPPRRPPPEHSSPPV